jgi:hypothetical protein
MSGCAWASEDVTVSIAGTYYLTTDYEGFTFLHYGQSWFKNPHALVGQLDSTGTAGPYLLVCQAEADNYYLLPLAARSEQQALAGLLGPLSRTACLRQLYQATGDTTLRLSATPR